MSELTVSDLREKLKRDLDLARAKVRALEDQLKWIESAINESNDISQETDEERLERQLKKNPIVK